MGAPLAGLRILCADNMSKDASAIASWLRGTCTDMVSPSKSALKAVQTKGCS